MIDTADGYISKFDDIAMETFQDENIHNNKRNKQRIDSMWDNLV